MPETLPRRCPWEAAHLHRSAVSSAKALFRIGLSHASNNMRGRGKNRRPLISAPIGPVKNSRGADLIRSEKLIIVDAIKDCETDSSGSIPDIHSHFPVQTTRRGSAGYQGGGQLANSPTVASFNITATPTNETCSGPKPPKKPRRSLLSTSSIPKPSFRTVSAATLAPRPIAIRQDENIPPASDGFFHPDPPTPRLVSKLPKSRTMNTLHDLKTSISRPSLAVRSINTSAFSSTPSKMPPSFTGTNATRSNSSKVDMPQPSAISLAKPVPSYTPQSPSMRVSTAQSSAYWSGRFVALHDRFSSENLAADARESRQSLADSFSALPKSPYSSLYQRASHLPTSTTTSALRSLMTSSNSSSMNEEDARCRRVFGYLDSLCITDEARRSLHIWQQAYARRHGRPSLLPEGGSMEEKSIMAKIFGGSVIRKAERHSLTGLRHGSYNHDNKSKSFLSGSISRASKGKRFTTS
ncbi:hypothetical protein Trco_005095 [Trichoderma cornu-damae]|uniref:Uncharacterized protein n=1 Tax=Trichoderma cornu-damae TaxID=654480 RepID=A0A9P8QNV7_9HYPO|nr:hypothetical protein Trco_005095 [Trichoderma cornu-damae]